MKILDDIAQLRQHLAELMRQSPPNPARILATQRALRDAYIRLLAVLLGIVLVLALVWYATLPRLSDEAATIPYLGHAIPLEQVRVVDPHPGCEMTHYHAGESGQVTATDGTVIVDEDMDCGFGPVQ